MIKPIRLGRSLQYRRRAQVPRASRLKARPDAAGCPAPPGSGPSPNEIAKPSSRLHQIEVEEARSSSCARCRPSGSATRSGGRLATITPNCRRRASSKAPAAKPGGQHPVEAGGCSPSLQVTEDHGACFFSRSGSRAPWRDARGDATQPLGTPSYARRQHGVLAPPGRRPFGRDHDARPERRDALVR